MKSLVYCFLFISLPQLVQAQSIAFKQSEVHDAIVFLQVLNDTVHQDSSVSKEVHHWRSLFNQTERGKEVLEKLGGNGIAFTYLFSHSNFTDLKKFKVFLEESNHHKLFKFLSIQMDEPAYYSAFSLVLEEKELFKEYISFLDSNHFSDRIDKHYKQDILALNGKGQEIIQKWDLGKLQEGIGFWVPNAKAYKDSIVILMSSFSGGYAYQLKGGKLGIPPEYINSDDLSYLIPHEIAHKFNPLPDILMHLKQLKEKRRM